MSPEGLSISASVGKETPGAPGGRLPPPDTNETMIVLTMAANRAIRANQAMRSRGWRRRVSSLRIAGITPHLPVRCRAAVRQLAVQPSGHLQEDLLEAVLCDDQPAERHAGSRRRPVEVGSP